jgi:hypothetical protein
LIGDTPTTVIMGSAELGVLCVGTFCAVVSCAAAGRSPNATPRSKLHDTKITAGKRPQTPTINALPFIFGKCCHFP